MTDNTTPERQSLRQVIAQTSKAVRTGPIELRRAAEVAETNAKALFKWGNGAEAKLAQLKLAEASRLRCYVWGDDLDVNAIADALADALVEHGFAGLVMIPQESAPHERGRVHD